MANNFSLVASTFRFEGTRFYKVLKDEVIKIHDQALATMLEAISDRTPNFTGESQATLRQFRDYLKLQNILVELRDFPREDVAANPRRFNKNWNVPAKITNLPNAGNETAYGKASEFKVVISPQKFNIHVEFTSGSEAFTQNPEMSNILDEAKALYKKEFKTNVDALFTTPGGVLQLKKFFNRVDVRSV